MKIPILMYHQIDQPPAPGTPLRGLVVAPNSFAWQMRLLRFMGYKGLSLRDLEPYLCGEKVGKVVGLTFDDGYQNNLTNALPVLQRNGFTATCYAVSRMIGGTNAWDRDQVATKLLMTQADWQLWIQGGMEVGSHTQNHADLNELDDTEARLQIGQSKADLELALGCQVRHFCYPYGRYHEGHARMVREAGYRSATTTNRGRVSPGDDPYSLRRVMVARATNPIQFFMKVATAHEDRRG